MPRYDTGWTMNAFIAWAFGQRTLQQIAEVLHEVRRRADFLVEVPDERSVRHNVRRLARRLEDIAAQHFWFREERLAESLRLACATRLPPDASAERLTLLCRAIDVALHGRAVKLMEWMEVERGSSLRTA